MFTTILLPLAPHSPGPATLAQVQSLLSGPDGRVVLLRLLEPEALSNPNQSRNFPELERIQAQLRAAGLICTVIKRRLQSVDDGTVGLKAGVVAGVDSKAAAEISAPAITAAAIADVAHELNVDVIVMGGPGVNLEIDSTSATASVIELVSCPVLVVPS